MFSINSIIHHSDSNTTPLKVLQNIYFMADEYTYICDCNKTASGPILVTSPSAKNPGAVFWACATKKEDGPCKFFNIVKKPSAALVQYTQRLKQQKENDFKNRQNPNKSTKPVYSPPMHRPEWDQRSQAPEPMQVSEPIDIPNPRKRQRMETDEEEAELHLARRLNAERKQGILQPSEQSAACSGWCQSDLDKRLTRVEEMCATILTVLKAQHSRRQQPELTESEGNYRGNDTLGVSRHFTCD